MIELTAPDELDGGEVAQFEITIKGKANEQVSVAVDSPSGVFTPPSQVVTIGDDGRGVFTTQYTADNKSETVVITANASNARSGGDSISKHITVYEVERVGNVTPIAETIYEPVGYLSAYPLDVPTPGTLRKVAIVAPTAATARIGLYTNQATLDGDAPYQALANVTASLLEGVNEISVPSQAISSGKYWMVVTYRDMTLTARGTTTTSGWTLTDYAFDQPFPATMPRLTPSNNMGQRNFYIVLRK